MIDLPDIEGVVVLNIPSWGAGADLWGSEKDGVSSARINLRLVKVSECRLLSDSTLPSALQTTVHV